MGAMHIQDGPSPPLPRPPVGTFSPVGSRPTAESTTTPASDAFVASSAPVETRPPAVGDKREQWVWDFAVMPPAPKLLQTTLRAVGEHGCIWVDDAAWGRTVTPAQVATLDQRFNREAPSGSVDPTKGIFDIDTKWFGGLPQGIDKDPRATILLTEFAAFNGTRMDGYFNAFDQMTDVEAQKYGQRSNERNIIYLNTAASPIDGDYMQGVLAHEFSHLCQWGRNPDQAAWLGETLAETAMALNGYHTDYNHVARHQAKPSKPLVSDTYVDYGAAYLFGTYLLERYGKAFVPALVEQSGAGADAIDAALQKVGSPDRFGQVFDDWVVANQADARPVVSSNHHYASLDVPAPREAATLDAANPRFESTLKPTGVDYVRLALPAGTQVAFHGDAAACLQLIRLDQGRLVAEKVDPSHPFQAPAEAVLAVSAGPSAALKYDLSTSR